MSSLVTSMGSLSNDDDDDRGRRLVKNCEIGNCEIGNSEIGDCLDLFSAPVSLKSCSS